MNQEPSPLGRGRPPQATRLVWTRDALRLVDDPASLEDTSPLVSHPAVVKLAMSSYKGRTCAQGLALRALLRDALAAIGRDLDGTIVGDLAVATLRGRTQASVAASRGLSEEWTSRRFKPVLTRLVLERLDRAAHALSQDAA